MKISFPVGGPVAACSNVVLVLLVLVVIVVVGVTEGSIG